MAAFLRSARLTNLGYMKKLILSLEWILKELLIIYLRQIVVHLKGCTQTRFKKRFERAI